MTDEEKLLEFLYMAPVGLIEFDSEGNVKLANPRVAQLFNRFAPGGYFANFFNFLDDFAPELRGEIQGFEATSGEVFENRRCAFKVPQASAEQEMYFDITVIKQPGDRFFTSINNVTAQVEAENKRFMTEQRLNRFFEGSTKHVFFTINNDGVVDSWNRTGESYLTSSEIAVGKVLSQLLPIENKQVADMLSVASSDGLCKGDMSITDKDNNEHKASMCLSKIFDLKGKNAGFSVVLTLN